MEAAREVLDPLKLTPADVEKKPELVMRAYSDLYGSPAIRAALDLEGSSLFTVLLTKSSCGLGSTSRND